MKHTLSILILSGLFALPLPGEEKKLQNISLTEIEGHHWLVDPSGKPFFAHSVWCNDPGGGHPGLQNGSA